MKFCPVIVTCSAVQELLCPVKVATAIPEMTGFGGGLEIVSVTAELTAAAGAGLLTAMEPVPCVCRSVEVRDT